MKENFMGFKPLIALIVILILTAAYVVGGADSISKKIEQYTDEHYKKDSVEYEKYTFMNATYCNWTAKYDRALEVLDKYDLLFVKDENREKSEFLRAKTYDDKIEARKAKDGYKKYIDDFPEGKHIEKARERYDDLKTYT